jgi:DNA modification methylase
MADDGGKRAGAEPRATGFSEAQPAELAPAPKNALYYGDNLEVMALHVDTASIDLVYLDPPFNSNATYNVLYSEQDGSRAAAQIKAFGDTWRWDQGAVEAYQKTVEIGGEVSTALQAFHSLLGGSNMMAYLAMMAPRLVELKRVLKPTGSLYLHCDSTASHYLKLLLDAVFGPEQFRNEIVWRRTGAHSSDRTFGRIHDTILFYSRSDAYYFHPITRPYMRGHAERRYTEDDEGRLKFTSGGNVLTGEGVRTGESGQPWMGFDPTKKHRHWAIPGFVAAQMPESFHSLGTLAKLEALYKAGLIEIAPGAAWPTPVRYLTDTDGTPVQDIWAFQPYTEGTVFGTDEGIDADVKWLGPTDPERLNYPTQKPLGLLSRIIRASCPPDGVVLDPFCGCGTAIDAAQELKRLWVGIDITHVAIGLIKSRLVDRWLPPITKTYRVVGEPTTVQDAAALAEEDAHQFQAWALGLVGARLKGEVKKGGDKGIDGNLYFHDSPDGDTKRIIISVKSGKLVPAFLRELDSVVARERAQIGVLISLHEPSVGIRAEAAESGFYESPWGKHPRLQLRTIGQLLGGQGIDYPYVTGANVSLRRALKAVNPTGVQTVAFEPDPGKIGAARVATRSKEWRTRAE